MSDFEAAQQRRIAIAKNQNTYAKRQREMEKKDKAREKQARREQRKITPDQPATDARSYGPRMSDDAE